MHVEILVAEAVPLRDGLLAIPNPANQQSMWKETPNLYWMLLMVILKFLGGSNLLSMISFSLADVFPAFFFIMYSDKQTL